MKKLLLKKCPKCGATVEVVQDCTCADCGFRCCNMPMVTIKPNSSEASFEKHLPVVEKHDQFISVKVNHVMEEAHYITWIALYHEGGKIVYELKPGNPAQVVFPYIKGSILYSYCNLHGLWQKDVE